MLPIDADIITDEEIRGIDRFYDRLADPVTGRDFGDSRGFWISRCLGTLSAYRDQQEFFAVYQGVAR